MKKKLFIICAITIVVILFCLGLFLNFKQKNKENEEKNLQEFKLDVKDEIKLNYGSDVPKFSDFCNVEGLENVKLEIYFADTLYEEDVLSELGEYSVRIIIDDKMYDSKIIVEDKEAPLLELKELTIKEGEKYDIASFIVKCEDNTEYECDLKFEKNEMSMYEKVGTYDITIVAKDESNNEKVENTKLIIEKKEKAENDKKIENNKNTTTNNNKNTNSSINEVKAEVTYKYGVKITTSGNKVTYDRSTFNATTNDLKEEASLQKSKEATNINQILTETNKYRAEKGLEPLILDNTLTLAANIRAMEMAWGDEVSHTRPDGRSCFTIFADVSYMSFYSGENIAWGQKNGTSAATWWRNSSGHYANMINESYTKIGIGVYKFDGKYYYVQLFSS